ncbi:Protein kinase-like domain [Pseudocohnilembus persalinus]|uniref:non-specific serine/threonine protein kinase n=1 Tax=Pseudocohnilembus persalinus TaxID=266149 RepID=A0A0V0QQU8_PSEPJ|nr:Protein kinase-like domain [Pseudocohnilembus persalinus]|eukprot:KRX04384.1 Protein kinase-like domain [Pseudocohnilembus persalinus]
MNVHKDKLVLLEVLINNQSVIQELYKNIQCSIIQYGFHEHYKPKKKIGKGSFACVYLAEHLKTGKDFAVKAFLKEKLNEEDKGFECLYNEINMLKVLNHPNIMTLYEVWESENSYYFILNLCQHGSLTEQISLAKKYKKNLQLLKKQKSQNFEESTHTGGSQKILPNNQGLSSLNHLNQLNSTSILNQNQIQRVPPLLIKSEIKYVMKQLLSALAHTYNKQIMHRDIKPDNIMISAKNQLEVVIADFGLGTYTNQTSYIYPKCGTPGYVAPEIINLKGSKEELKNINYSAICDMFSMGATFYFLVTLKQLFMGANTKETILLNKKCEIDYNSPEFKEMPSEVLDLIKKMLEIDPEKRITPQEAMEHPWLQDVNLNDSSKLGLFSQKSLKVQLEQEKFNVDETEISSDEGSHNIRKKLNILNFQNTCFSKMSPSRSALSQIQSQFRFSDKCQSTNFNSNLNSTIEQQDRYFEKELKSFNSYNSEIQTSFRSCLSHQSSLVFKNAAYHYSKNRMLSIDDKLEKMEDETSNKNFETNLFSQHGNRLKAPGNKLQFNSNPFKLF